MDNKDKIIELLRQELSTMKTCFSETVALLDEKSALLKAALIRIAALEQSLRLNSKNSSKPPSTDVFIKPQSLQAKGINKKSIIC